MKTLAAALAALCCAAPVQDKDAEGFISLFNGKDLSGWKANENEKTFRVEDGKIISNGERSHLFYTGDVKAHDFKDFEFKCEVNIQPGSNPGSNAGIYFHTEFQDKDWPKKGFEAQVCSNDYKDPRKTGSLYAVKDLAESPVKDDEWFEYHILVNGKKVEIRLNGKSVNEWTQPDGFQNKGQPGRVLDKGTFALQCHDPKSVVYFKNLRVKVLPD
jgi:hypothetical protein